MQEWRRVGGEIGEGKGRSRWGGLWRRPDGLVHGAGAGSGRQLGQKAGSPRVHIGRGGQWW